MIDHDEMCLVLAVEDFQRFPFLRSLAYFGSSKAIPGGK